MKTLHELPSGWALPQLIIQLAQKWYVAYGTQHMPLYYNPQTKRVRYTLRNVSIQPFSNWYDWATSPEPQGIAMPHPLPDFDPTWVIVE